MRRQVVVNLDCSTDAVETYEQADRNLGQIRVQLPTGEMVCSNQYRVELAMSRDAMIGFATALLRMAHEVPSRTVFGHARPIEPGLASMSFGFYLTPESCELMVAEDEFGTVTAQIEALEARSANGSR